MIQSTCNGACALRFFDAGAFGCRSQPRLQWTKPGGVRLARAGRGVNQPGRSSRVRTPHLALKSKRLPAIPCEPAEYRVVRSVAHNALRSARSIALMVASESASFGSLSVRHRLIRGKRTAIPLLCRVLS